MSDIYDVDYFIRKFEAIPEELWCVGAYSNGGARCALGHCGIGLGKWTTPEQEGLDKILTVPAPINDGADPRYQQPTPRARILAALQDIKNGKVAK